jgi:ribosomal protein S18 acetylase RimI-like enzyme
MYMEEMERRAGPARLTLRVPTDQSEAVRFYQRRGYDFTGSRNGRWAELEHVKFRPN